ncbi:DUF4252 domain-containing protein [Oleiharenicola lentus]|uniref:DUF4252 domain-containing protein n=1 Tax=Oleiharenicola lentus TaxID=2508720 RepID=UPI003F6739C2
MKTLIRSTLVAAAASFALITSSFAADADNNGAIDIGQLMPAARGEFVEVNISAAMLKFASKLASRQEPDAAVLIAGLKSIRVNVVSMDDSNRDDVVSKIEAVRRKIEGSGWTKMVTVRDSKNGDNVDVHVKQRGEDAVDGLVVTVIDRKGEAVFVNIVGNIDADQIAKIADKFEIEPLRKISGKVKKSKADTEV